ncbi:hypothetical protein Daus18300_008164 [Diaporthe australafricana]|uniref:Major facilitator superfamily (MFS) profile domain-containing protein n=1 Tax=Diaporthe australafricana TaxID=127596 RepID=A0ABR3WJP4_9PEZI
MTETTEEPKSQLGSGEDVRKTEALNISSDPETEGSKPSGAQTVSDDSSNEVRGAKLILINTALCICTLLVGLDFTLIATAIPRITSEFHSIQDVGWYGAAFQLALCASQPLAGKTFVLFSKKLVYLTYLAIFEVGSLVCALAPSSQALIVGRAVAGLGASGMFAGGFAVQAAIIPLHKRAIWIGVISSTFAIASIVGPVIGGALTEHVTWRWCFYINLPIGGFAAGVFAILVHIKPASSERVSIQNKVKGLDLFGFALFSGFMIMILLALQWGGVTYSWSSSTVIGLLVGGVVVMGLFIPWQLYMKDDALIPPRLFRAHRNVGLICASSFFVNGPFQVIIYWLPIWFQAVRGRTPTESGVDYLPTVISDAVMALLGTGVVMKIGWWNPFLLFANAMVCLCGGLLSTIYLGISSGHLIGYQILGGVGYSLATNLAQVGMQTSLPPDLVPTGSSNLLMFVSTSCSVFLALGQVIFQKGLVTRLSDVVAPDLVDKVISAGATNFRSVVPASDLPAVVEAYGKSCTEVFVVLVLEELQVPYEIKSFKFEEIKKKPFIDINPNGRVPAIEDPNTGFALWESGAIINYLIELYDKKNVLSYDTFEEKHKCNQWLHFQMSGQGPYFGQAGWFNVLHAEKLPSAIERYQAEVRRIQGVLDRQLQGKQWLVGDKMTYADLAFAPWNDRTDALLQCAEDKKFEGFPNLAAWHERVTGRASWKKAMETRAVLMDEQGLDWHGMPKGMKNMAEYQAKIKAEEKAG